MFKINDIILDTDNRIWIVTEAIRDLYVLESVLNESNNLIFRLAWDFQINKKYFKIGEL